MPSKALLRPADVLAEAKRIPGVPTGHGELDAAGGPRPPRRGDPRPRRLRRSCPGWKNARSTSSAATARFDGERRVCVGDEVADRRAGGRRRHRQRRGDAADRRPRRGRGLEQPRRDHRQAGAGEHDRARRRPGRQRALAGLGQPRRRGDPGRGRRAPALARGGRSPARKSPTSLRERFGVDVRTGAKVESGRAPAAPASSRRSSGGEQVEAAEILIAVGRVPHTAELDLEAAGVEADEHGFLDTDDRMRVGGRDWLYAIGDVNGRALFTHMGKYQAWVAAENLLGREVEAVAEGIGSPRVTFTDPQVAAVGKTLEQAARSRASTPAPSTSPPTAPPAPASRARTPAAPRGIVVDQAKRDDRRRHLHRLRDRRLPPGRDRRDRRRGAALAPAPRGRALPQPAARSG